MIGGDFPIVVTDVIKAKGQLSLEPGVYSYSSGRAALYQILRVLKNNNAINRILLPDYLCSSVLVPVKLLDLEYAFYPTDIKLELIPDSFAGLFGNGTAVLLINYFGLKELTEQINIIRSIDENAVIIEDDVQAFFEFLKPLGNVDFKFTSLRKTFAIPDGGLVKTTHQMPNVSSNNRFGQYKAAAAMVKSLREDNFEDNIYLELFEKGETLIDSDIECGMSKIANKLYSSVNIEKVKERRLHNANYLLKLMKMEGLSPILPLSDGHVPLFIPILIKNRDAVRREMFKKEIYCPVHWPLDGLYLQRGKIMSEQELSLIIDQRYTCKEMDEIIAILIKYIDCFNHE